jgi:hypothetical protein
MHSNHIPNCTLTKPLQTLAFKSIAPFFCLFTLKRKVLLML